MALYENNLFLVRRGGPLLAEVVAGGDLVVSEEDAATLLDGLPCLYREFAVPGTGPAVLRLSFFDPTFEPFMQREARRLLEWLWSVFERYRLDYAFMGGGLAYEGYDAGERVTDRRVFEQLDELVGQGAVRFPHPLMLFADHLAGGRLTTLANAAPYYRVERREGVGTLLLLTNDDLTADSIEILEPGMIYEPLVRYFHTSTKR
jgi:hypothetical protein